MASDSLIRFPDAITHLKGPIAYYDDFFRAK
jgi:hypothetical protein